MNRPATAEQCILAFGNAIVSSNWEALYELLALDSVARTTPADLAKIFGWETLELRLRTDWSVQTEEPEDPNNPLAPPVTFRSYPVSQASAARCELLDRERKPVFAVVDFAQFEEWHEICFEPAKESGFDVSYQCEVAVDDMDGARLVGAFVIGNVMD